MATYSPYGKAHKVLTRLAQGDAPLDEIALVLGMGARTAKRDRLWWLVGSLLEDRLIGGRRANYYITEEGRDVLLALQSGKEALVARANIRRFA